MMQRSELAKGVRQTGLTLGVAMLREGGYNGSLEEPFPFQLRDRDGCPRSRIPEGRVVGKHCSKIERCCSANRENSTAWEEVGHLNRDRKRWWGRRDCREHELDQRNRIARRRLRESEAVRVPLGDLVNNNLRVPVARLALDPRLEDYKNKVS